MSLSTYRPLPTELADIQCQMEERAKNYGLDFFRTIFEVLDYEELSMFAAYGGFPVRYPHWKWGMEYESLSKRRLRHGAHLRDGDQHRSGVRILAGVECRH